MAEFLLVVFYVFVTWLVYPVASSFQSSALIVAGVLVTCLLFGRQWPLLLTRTCCYSASVLLMYLLTQHKNLEAIMPVVNGYLVCMVLFLVLGIRMTRREDFSLDTQDGEKLNLLMRLMRIHG